MLVLLWGKLVSHAVYRKIAKLFRCWVGRLNELKASYVKMSEKGVQSLFYFIIIELGGG